MRWLLIVAALITCCMAQDMDGVERMPTCAIMTILVGNDYNYVDAAITLGHSLVSVGTQADMILLHTMRLDNSDRDKLTERGGWMVKEVENLIPTQKGKLFHRSLTRFVNKLYIFGETDYDVVVFLDADTLVTHSIDELCYNIPAEFAAVVHGAYFNSGVLVVRPNEQRFDAIMKAALVDISSYHADDQSFLNRYFWPFDECIYIDPQGDTIYFDEHPIHRCARIPARYNGNLVAYTWNDNQWPYSPTVDGPELPKIIHYNFNNMKPWRWWTFLFIPEAWVWWGHFEATTNDNTPPFLNFLFAVAIYGLYLFTLYQFSQYLGDLFMSVVYERLIKSIPITIIAYVFIQIILIWLSFLFSMIYCITPFINSLVFSALLYFIFHITLFHHLKKYKLRSVMLVQLGYLIFLPAFNIIFLLALGNEITYLPRVVIYVVLGITHVFISFYYFVRYILVPLDTPEPYNKQYP